MIPIKLTDENFDAEVLQTNKLTLVDFWATWCSPCIAMHPMLDSLAKEYDGKLTVGKMNLDDNFQISIRYGITSVPCILIIKDGIVLEKQVGAISKNALEKKVMNYLN